MSMKDEMLKYIVKNVNWIMTTNESVEVIPYDELQDSTFRRVKQCFASDAKKEDVVCLISTSILETGKTGVLFTTNYVYCKAWGPLTKSCKNRICRNADSFAEFDWYNEFDTGRMKRMMVQLNEIAMDAQKEESFNETIETVSNFVDTLVAGSRFVTNLLSALNDENVTQKNEEIKKLLS